MVTKLRKFGIIFSKLIPSGMPIPVLTGPLRGAKWVAGSGAGKGKGLSVVLNLTEPEQLDMARRLVPTDGICFDIGANVGFYTLLFARYSRHVFAFEPLPRNVRYLSKTLEVNDIRNATIVPCAVCNCTGLSLFRDGSNCGLGKLDSKGRRPVFTVSCDDFVSHYKVVPSLLKIDVEGAEMLVLEGAENLLSNYKPVILLSTHGEAIRISCLGFLKDMKYAQIVPINSHQIDTADEFAIIP